MHNDTIFALSSGPGRAGIAVIRLSGPASRIALRALSGTEPAAPRRAVLGSLVDPASGEALDRCIRIWYPAPRSFTGEDVVELHLHGGPAVVAGVLDALGGLPDLRPAEPGEFTRRAFDNGKLDLAEVEGLADLMAAETEAQRRQALAQMEGALSRRVEDWRERLSRLLAHYEAAIDFPEDDEALALALPRLQDEMARLEAELGDMLADRRRGERLREGLKVAVVGAPNVGKSSLINALSERDVAIVSDLAGTTRDVIAVHLDLAGLPVTVLDTAGLRLVDEGSGGAEAVEAEGIRRARAEAGAADIRLAVFDARTWPSLDRETLGQLGEGPALVVLNKIDLLTGDEEGTDRLPDEIAGHRAVRLSARTGSGLRALVEALAGIAGAMLAAGSAGGDGVALVTRARHRTALEAVRQALVRARSAELPELAAEDLRLGVRALGRVTGKVDVEDLLDVVFRDFCIGK